MSEKYRLRNGTEGEWFMEEWRARCQTARAAARYGRARCSLAWTTRSIRASGCTMKTARRSAPASGTAVKRSGSGGAAKRYRCRFDNPTLRLGVGHSPVSTIPLS